MADAIVKIIASLLAYFTARGIDKLIAKWVAYFVIAWEMAVSTEAMQIFRDNVKAIKEGMAKNGNDILKWRKDHLGEAASNLEGTL